MADDLEHAQRIVARHAWASMLADPSGRGLPDILAPVAGQLDWWTEAAIEWLGAYATAVGVAPGSGGAVSVRWVDVSRPGEVLYADDVQPPARWAGRLLAAWIADDIDQLGDLWDAVMRPDEQQQMVDHGLALLSLCAHGALAARPVTGGQR